MGMIIVIMITLNYYYHPLPGTVVLYIQLLLNPHDRPVGVGIAGIELMYIECLE